MAVSRPQAGETLNLEERFTNYKSIYSIHVLIDHLVRDISTCFPSVCTAPAQAQF